MKVAMIGGPAHGEWHEVSRLEHDLLVPVIDVQPASFQSTAEPLYDLPPVVRYELVKFSLFGQLAVAYVDPRPGEHERNRLCVEHFLSSQGKRSLL